MNMENGEMSINQNSNAEFADELDLQNLIDSEEPELRKLDEIDENPNENVVVKADFLSILLGKYGDDGVKLEDNFRLHNIQYKDLAALSDNDLRLFGVSDKNKRRIILGDFSAMVNQDMHYDRELAALNLDEYGLDGLNNVRKHLYYLKVAIRASLLKMYLHPAEDTYVADGVNASELLLKTLEEMKKSSNAMEEQLLNLAVKKENIKKPKGCFKCWKFLLVLGAVSGAVLYKYYRIKLFKI